MRVWQEEELRQGSNCIIVSCLSLESESAAGNAPEAKARLRTATLLILGDKTANGICAHLVEPLEGYYEEEEGGSKGGAWCRSWEATRWRRSGRGSRSVEIKSWI